LIAFSIRFCRKNQAEKEHEMEQGTQSRTDRLISLLLIFALAPALAAAIISFYAYINYFDHLGNHVKAVIMALFVALAIGGGYLAIIHVLLKGVARLPAKERARLNPLILVVWLVISLASAFPIFIHAGKGEAIIASSNAYISSLQLHSDRLKSAALAFDQIGPVLDNGIATMTSLRDMERSGIFSGARSEGALSRWINGFAERLLAARLAVSSSAARTQDLITGIDRAIDQMRVSLTDRELDLEGRKRALQRAADEVRNHMVALRQTAPVSSLKNLAASLRSKQAYPRLSQNPKVRRGQMEGITRIADELRKIGRDLERRVDDMAQALKVRIPAYETPPDSILVLSNLAAVPHIAMASWGLDTLPLILYLIVVRLYDAERSSQARGRASSGWRTGGHEWTERQDSEAPYPHAASVRHVNGAGKSGG
jgi:hypothetical protein